MFKSKPYHFSIPFRGEANPAMGVARTALLSLGFEVLEDNGDILRAKGPGMHSNRQPALLGASEITIEITDSEIHSTSRLGGVDTMKTFVYLFPPGLILALLIFFSLLSMQTPWLFGLTVIPWFFISPFIASKIEVSTTKAIERLIRGMAQAK